MYGTDCTYSAQKKFTYCGLQRMVQCFCPAQCSAKGSDKLVAERAAGGGGVDSDMWLCDASLYGLVPSTSESVSLDRLASGSAALLATLATCHSASSSAVADWHSIRSWSRAAGATASDRSSAIW